MRIKLSLNRTTKQRMLPMDYQYYISAWIYKVLKQADKDFAEFLHEKGYGTQGKLYKLFCFSRLNFGKPTLWKEKKLFEIKLHTIELIISFDVPEIATHFIEGLFMNHGFYLGDKFNGIDFQVSGLEVLPEPSFSETMNYRLQTPWVVSYRIEGQKNAQYLRPEHELFNKLSKKHLIEKYKATRNVEIDEAKLVFEALLKYKRSGFLIKKDTPKESRVIGNIFSFSLTAPVELHQMIWNAGVSEKSSSGFGWLEIDNKKIIK